SRALAAIRVDVASSVGPPNIMVPRHIGEILMSRPRVVRTTRSLIFVATEVTVGDRCIVMASGVFKILKNET
ncbi:MAG TPA: hypothetical protein VK678_19380, partial [Bradyrhizobium sp.]|nr:hypothetical protein [Bradyrhizobium sp.]